MGAEPSVLYREVSLCISMGQNQDKGVFYTEGQKHTLIEMCLIFHISGAPAEQLVQSEKSTVYQHSTKGKPCS